MSAAVIGEGCGDGADHPALIGAPSFGPASMMGRVGARNRGASDPGAGGPPARSAGWTVVPDRLLLPADRGTRSPFSHGTDRASGELERDRTPDAHPPRLPGARSGVVLSGPGRCCSPPERRRCAVVPASGPLRDDPDGLLALPAGFSYRLVTAAGRTRLESGEPTPAPRRHRRTARRGGGTLLVAEPRGPRAAGRCRASRPPARRAHLRPRNGGRRHDRRGRRAGRLAARGRRSRRHVDELRRRHHPVADLAQLRGDRRPEKARGCSTTTATSSRSTPARCPPTATGPDPGDGLVPARGCRRRPRHGRDLPDRGRRRSTACSTAGCCPRASSRPRRLRRLGSGRGRCRSLRRTARACVDDLSRATEIETHHSVEWVPVDDRAARKQPIPHAARRRRYHPGTGSWRGSVGLRRRPGGRGVLE